jgi:ATP diphosphatase
MSTPHTLRLLDLMAQLRHPKTGCAWDIEQTFRTIAPCTIEEAYEVADAIEHDDMAALRDELGDLLLQVVFHSRMAEEAGHFDFEAVAEAICDKLVRRHPHVFGDAVVKDAADQTRAWEAIKAKEREAKVASQGPVSALDGVSPALPALTRALKFQNRAARVGFDWPEAVQVLDKIAEETGELREAIAQDAGRDALEEELGDLLFACVNLARKLDLDPETALRRGNIKFDRRFRSMERLLKDKTGKRPEAASLDEMESFWQAAKAEE